MIASGSIIRGLSDALSPRLMLAEAKDVLSLDTVAIEAMDDRDVRKLALQQAQQAQKLLADAAEVKEKLVAGATKTIESMDDNDVRKMAVKQAQKQKQKVSKLFGKLRSPRGAKTARPEI